MLRRQKEQSVRTLVADGSVRPQDGLLGAFGLELGQESAGDVEARDLVVLGQLEPEALGVVVDRLNLLQLQAEETLLPSGEGLLRLGAGDAADGGLGDLLDLRFGLLRSWGAWDEEVVAREADRTGAGRIEEGGSACAVGRGLGVGGVAADLLRRIYGSAGRRRAWVGLAN